MQTNKGDDRIFQPERLLFLLEQASNQTLESHPALATLLTSVYLASLYKEENRDVRCRLLVWGAASEHDVDLLRLAQPLQLTVTRLRRLSLAATESDSVIVVDCKDGSPMIVGLGTVTAVAAYLSVIGARVEPPEISLLGPGVVEMSACGATVTFARDRYFVPRLRHATSLAISMVSEEALVHRVVYPGISGWIGYSQGQGVGMLDLDLFKMHRDAVKAEAPAAARCALSEYLNELVRAVRVTGSGGAVLIVPHFELPGVEELMSGYAVARGHERYRGEMWNAGVLNVFEWLLHVQLARLGKLLKEKLVTPKHWIKSTGLRGLSDATAVQAKDARRVGQLTAIDGALVLNEFLSPVLFGGKFTNVDINALPENVQASVMTRGMRHRSMAATVHAIANSAGIVVSQDAEVTVFANVEGKVCCHSEEEVPAHTSGQCVHTHRVPATSLLQWMAEIMREMEEAE